MNVSTLHRFLPVAILLLGLALFLLLGLSRYFSFDMLSRNHAELTAWVAANGGLAALTFAIGYAIAIAFSLPVGMLLTPVAGYLFGAWLGAILAIIGATLGAIAVFLAAR